MAKESQKLPSNVDPEWNDYVISLLTEDEKIEDKPTCAGLRRVARILLGETTFSGCTNVWPVQGDGFGRATVQYQITFESGSTYVDVADVWQGNVDGFLNFAVATACTRAEVRCLRKALMLKTVAAEEIQEEPSGERITDAQIKMINNQCKKGDLDAMAIVQSVKQVKDVKSLSKTEALEVISKITNKPEDYPGYKEGWMS